MDEVNVTKRTKEEQYKDLVISMRCWQRHYDIGRPVISDFEWDDYYTNLLRLEKELGYVDPESPSQKIHYDVVNELKKVEHNHPMLSLDKTKDIEEIKAFIDGHDWICMAKMDGLTCSLHYRGGRLVRAETRGNGKIGEDITHNAYKIPSIPKTIDSMYDTVVDGEIICTYNNFEKFSTEYSNPRNFASGSIRLLDSNECAKRGLIFVAWDMINGYNRKENDPRDIITFHFPHAATNEEVLQMSDKEFEIFIKQNSKPDPITLSEKLMALYQLGFTIVPARVPLLEHGDIFEEIIEELKNYCKKLSYPIDGLVFKYDNCKEYDAAGRTEHHFKGGLAYKFYDELYETELIDIEWSMGRTGVLTPVAIFKEIEIEGAKINRASLHNVSVMNQLLSQPFVGQKIRIFRANQIIPQVYDAEDSHLSISTLRITHCPVCGERLKLNNNDGVITLICPNENCEGKLLNKLDHFCGKKGLDIKGLSKATLEKLMDWGWVENIEDIFTLNKYRQEWINKEGFGVKSVDRIFAAIEASKYTELYQFISSLGIPLIGLSVAKDLALIYGSYEAFRKDVDAGYNFSELPGFGYEKTKSLLSFDYTIADNVRTWLFLTNEIAKKTDKTLDGITFCITGKLQFYKNRTELKNEIEKFGGKVTDSVSSKTTYLINNDINSTSSKNKTAKQLGIPIITEQQLKDMIN